MKAALFLILSVIVFMETEGRKRGCYRVHGVCYSLCPKGTHEYAGSACRSPTWSERTCEEQEVRDMGAVCDLSRCDCDHPTVRDTVSNKCVMPEDCPKPGHKSNRKN